MTVAEKMLETSPRSFNLDRELLVRCIEACEECAQACTACADDCLGEDDVAELVKCIRTNLDCADICTTTGRVLSRQTEYDANITGAILQACIASCKACGDECARHAEHGMEHCRVCAESCRACESACDELLAALP